MAQTDIVLPIVHRNGDSKATLIGQLETAYKAVRAAEQALQQCAGNARNFYPDPGRWERYGQQHRARMRHVQAILDSLVAEVQGIETALPPAR